MNRAFAQLETAGEDEVVRLFDLVGKSKRAQQLAIDRLWRRMQNMRKDAKLKPLKRVKLGPRLRYVYSRQVLDDWFRILEDSD